MPTERPNVLLLCSDQQHWRMNGFNGHPLVRTPNLDRLAERATNFRCAYSNSPVCAPSRAAMFTGRLPSEVGAFCNSLPFDGRAPTFGTIAREQGYYCFASGKFDFWHGRDYGFEEDGVAHGHDTNPDITSLFRNPMCRRPAYDKARTGGIRETPARDWETVRRTVSFLKERSRALGKPWLAYSGWNLPHPPFLARPDLFASYPLDRMDLPELPPDWREREHPVIQMSRWHRCCERLAPEEDVRRARAAYYAMITEVDEMVGTVLRALDESGQTDNTVMIFTSDHGEMVGEHGLFLKNLPHEGCARVPLLIAGPGFPAGEVIETPVSLMDIHATVVDLVGGPTLEGVRGRSLRPLAHGDAGGHPFVLVELNTERLLTGVFTVREGDWKYNYYADYPDELFDLRSDPDEWANRAADPACAGVRERMRRTLFSVYDPDEVSDRAFAAQAARLDQLMEGHDEAYMVEMLRSRLGAEQAAHFARRYFRKRRSLGDGAGWAAGAVPPETLRSAHVEEKR